MRERRRRNKKKKRKKKKEKRKRKKKKEKRKSKKGKRDGTVEVNNCWVTTKCRKVQFRHFLVDLFRQDVDTVSTRGQSQATAHHQHKG